MRCTVEERDLFFKKIRKILDDAVIKGTIDAWFFNWANADSEEKANAENLLNSLLGGQWRFVTIHGNGTNVGKGWFANDEYDFYLCLECFSEDEDFIDSYEVDKKEECVISNIEE